VVDQNVESPGTMVKLSVRINFIEMQLWSGVKWFGFGKGTVQVANSD
jgi:hypothetical protein